MTQTKLTQLPAAKARKKFADMIAEAYYLKKRFLIEKCGKPMAVVINIEDYEELLPPPPPKKTSI